MERIDQDKNKNEEGKKKKRLALKIVSLLKYQRKKTKSMTSIQTSIQTLLYINFTSHESLHSFHFTSLFNSFHFSRIIRTSLLTFLRCALARGVMSMEEPGSANSTIGVAQFEERKTSFKSIVLG